MIPDKEIKKKFKPIFFKDPDKYFPTKVLKAEGFHRNICSKCSRPFWSTELNRRICGDPSCVGGFSFIGDTPAKEKMSYIEVWEKFSEMFRKKGYTAIKRYPVVSRWNPTMEYTNASIAAFQPYVVNGEIDPPANPLVIPQFSIRFVDIDNVGITGSHCTGFVMIGQHAFVNRKEWNQEKYFKDIYDWAIYGLKVPKDELIIHEDAWAGGGNFGCCMEFFSRGLELFNQVYMMYEQTEENGYRELTKKVLDMGLGMERNAWFSQGKGTMYDATFPEVIDKLKRVANVDYDEELFKKFIPLAPRLNMDETDDIEKAWKEVAGILNINVTELKNKILPMQAIYSIAEHSRTLLFALNDSAIPSNVGGGYNLRLILRRALNFIEKYNWSIDLNDVIDWHAEYLKPIFPELSENLEEVHKIIDIERQKYKVTREKAKQIISKLAEKDITKEKLIELYDSHGIHPEEVKEEMNKRGLIIRIPDNFYALVAERHEKTSENVIETATRKEANLDLENIPDTEILYYDNYMKLEFDAVVLKVINEYVILDKTAFYPTSGGQLHDTGMINKIKVIDVFKQGKVIVHKLERKADFHKGEIVHGKIDYERRKQLAQHHTATHIINAVARVLLGKHIWQAGAAKFVDKSRLDITHFENLTKEQISKIEELANKMIRDNLPVEKYLMPRNLAEAKYGFVIYQGGAVPGKILRIVNIPGFDAEACGGTHTNLTGEVEMIKILKTSKIQDGIVRIEFVAGTAAKKAVGGQKDMEERISKMLKCNPEQIPGRVEELFSMWKSIVKKGKDIEFKLESMTEYKGDVIAKACEILRSQPEHLERTIKRFLDEISAKQKK